MEVGLGGGEMGWKQGWEKERWDGSKVGMMRDRMEAGLVGGEMGWKQGVRRIDGMEVGLGEGEMG